MSVRLLFSHILVTVPCSPLADVSLTITWEQRWLYKTPSTAALRALRAVPPAQSAPPAISWIGEMGMLMENKALSAPLHLVGQVLLSPTGHS